jgi:hypothetical protein
MIDTMSLADATADLIAEQRRAMLERAGIEVCFDQRGFTWIGTLVVVQNGVTLGTFTDYDTAFAYAYDLAEDQS